MKKRFLGLLIAWLLMFSMLSLTACTGNGKSTGEQPSWWSEDQIKTISSIRQVDEAGFLYEMDYTADYKLDEIIKAGTYPNETGYKSIQETLIGNSEFDLPKNQL